MRRLMRRILYHWSIEKKIFVPFSVLSVAVVLIFAMYIGFQTHEIILENSISAHRSIANRIALDVTKSLDDYSEAINELSFSKNILEFLKTQFTSDWEQYDFLTGKLQTHLTQLEQYAQSGVMFRLYHQNPTITMSRFFSDDERLLGIPNAAALMQHGFSRPVLLGWIEINGEEHLVLYAAVRDNKALSRSLGLVLLYIPVRVMQNKLSQNGQFSAPVLLLDAEGNTIAASRALTDEEVEHLNARSRYTITVPLTTSDTGFAQWSLLYLIPTNAIDRVRANVGYGVGVVSLLMLLFSFSLSWLFARSLSSRLRVLVRHMSELGGGNISDRIASSDTDEIGQLYQHYNGTLSRLEQLMEEKHEAETRIQKTEIALQKARYDALQHQINPHYLFNTLESIRMRLITVQQREIAGVVSAFADSFRAVLESNQALVSLSQELKFIEKYMQIQCFRYNNVEYHVSCACEEALDCRVPALIIQPLIENSLYHGYQRTGAPFHLHILITSDQKYVSIRVEDNGCGIAPDELEKIREELAAQTRNNRYLALKNIVERLNLLYNGKASLELFSDPGGTVVHIKIPYEVEYV